MSNITDYNNVENALQQVNKKKWHGILIHQAAERAWVFSQNLIVDKATNVVEKGNEDQYYRNLKLGNVIKSAMKSFNTADTKVV